MGKMRTSPSSITTSVGRSFCERGYCCDTKGFKRLRRCVALLSDDCEFGWNGKRALFLFRRGSMQHMVIQEQQNNKQATDNTVAARSSVLCSHLIVWFQHVYFRSPVQQMFPGVGIGPLHLVCWYQSHLHVQRSHGLAPHVSRTADQMSDIAI